MISYWLARNYRKSRRAVLEYLAAKGDAARLLRELIEGQWLARKRDDSAYWRNE